MEPVKTPEPALPQRRGGRPNASPSELRSVTVGLRLTPAEHAQLLAKSHAAGLSVGTFLRHAATATKVPKPPVPAVNRQGYIALGRLANNLNQLAKAANSGLPVDVETATLSELIAEIQALRGELLGAK